MATATAALILYPLAVSLPILEVTKLGRSRETGILEGTARLLGDGHVFVGLVVLVCSVILPLLKLLSLMLLSSGRGGLRRRHRAATYRVVEWTGRYGMLDVLCVAVLVAVLKLGDIVSVSIGPGALVRPAQPLRDRHLRSARPVGGERMTSPDELPTAVARPRGARVAWILPLLALVAAAWAGWRHWSHAGPTIAVVFEDGHGLAPDAEVRYRGIAVGTVRAVELDPTDDVVLARIDLGPGADAFARDGARFWIVRPQIDLESGVRGAETLLGPRYVAARPGDGKPRHSFVGLEEPLVVEETRPGDLRVVLEAPERGNLDAGTPLTYRDVQIGVVLDVGLAGDARSVEATAHVPAQFAPLVRERTEFYFDGGVAAEWGSRFLFLEFGGQLTRVLAGGGVALAIPPDPGPAAPDGRRFVVRPAPEEDWETWNPSIPLFGGAGRFDGDEPAGDGEASTAEPAPARPTPVAARLTWRAGIFRSRHSHEGWVLPTSRGLLGPVCSPHRSGRVRPDLGAARDHPATGHGDDAAPRRGPVPADGPGEGG